MVVVLVNATDYWSFHWIIQIILSAFSTDYIYVKILRRAEAFLYFSVMQMRNYEHWTIFVIKNIANSRF